MKFKNKRLISAAIVVVLVIVSLIGGTVGSKEQSKESSDGYLADFLMNQTVHKLTLKEGSGSEVIQKISVEGEIGSEMTNTYSRGSIINQIKVASADPSNFIICKYPWWWSI